MKDLLSIKMNNNMRSQFEDKDRVVEKPQLAWTDNAARKKSCLKQILRPLLVFMAISGCYNFSDLYEINRSEAPNRPKPTFKRTLSYMYRFGVFVVLLALLCKFLASFYFLPAEAHMMIGMCCVWCLGLIALFLVHLKMTSTRFGYYEAAFTFWEEKIIPDFIGLELECPVGSIKRTTTITMTVAVVGITLNIVSMIVQVEIENAFFYTAPFAETTVTITVGCLLFSIATMVWLIPPAWAIIMSSTLSKLFESFTKSLQTSIKSQGNTIPSNFQKLRLLHADISKLVADIDQDMGWYYGTSFVFGIGLGVFNLYQVMKTDLDTYSIGMFLFWLSAILGIMALTSIYAAFVHEQAHAPLDIIYYINVQDITVEKLAQLNLFLSKLTGTQVGFTACGLITITKEFILTIAGVFLTYFAVLYTL